MKKNLISLRSTLDRFLLRARTKATGIRGDSHLISVIVMAIVAVVLIVVVIFPQFADLFKNSFTNANSKIDEIWNYH